MKVIIELDNDMLKEIRKSDFEVSRKIVRDFQATIADSIRNGEPIPEGATNGEMIKSMFPNVEIEGVEGLEGLQCIAVSIGLGTSYFALDWWNAPYKKEVE